MQALDPAERIDRDARLVRGMNIGDVALITGVWRPIGSDFVKEFTTLYILRTKGDWGLPTFFSMNKDRDDDPVVLPMFMTRFRVLKKSQVPRHVHGRIAYLSLNGRFDTKK